MPAVTLTEEQQAAIFRDFIEAFKAQFGDAWRQSLTKNLRPSPIKEIAERHGVSQAAVRKMRHELLMFGILLGQALNSENVPPE